MPQEGASDFPPILLALWRCLHRLPLHNHQTDFTIPSHAIVCIACLKYSSHFLCKLIKRTVPKIRVEIVFEELFSQKFKGDEFIILPINLYLIG